MEKMTEKPVDIRISRSEAFLLMASIEGKQEQIIRLLEKTDSSRIGNIEGLNKEYSDLTELHKKITEANSS